MYCGRATWDLLCIDAAIRRSELRRSAVFWEKGKAFRIGPFAVTPFLIDHSAFDAYVLLIEVDGKRILYTGDFRAQGRKSELTLELIENPPPNIDVLIMEGTNLPGKGAGVKETRSEADLEDEFVRIFKETPGRVFVSAAATNADRLVTLFRACKKSGRVLAVDLYTMIVLRTLGKYAALPRPEWENAPLKLVVTGGLLGLAERLGHSGLVEELKPMGKAMGARGLNGDKRKWVALIRGGMVKDFRNNDIVPDDGDAWLWSLWTGYLGDGKQKELSEFFGGRRPIVVHTSGHASPEVLVELAKAVNPRLLIPVHGTEWEGNAGLFGGVALRIAANGESVEI